MRRSDTERARARLVERHVKARGITDERILAAMGSVKRERYVPAAMEAFAYDDHPLPIGEGQTISQPFIVALMADAAQIVSGDRVLEVGAGSGYGAAVLAQLAAEVWTIERLEPLAELARKNLERDGVENVHVVVGDGTLGWPVEAPFDAIVVTAGGPEVPHALLDQLAVGGRLVMPTGSDRHNQALIRVVRLHDQPLEDAFSEEELGLVRFVPLIGAQGWDH
ncbi:MAG: protein-L-isoaspartate(D-aspartate) O-methyltransferase [Acidimicrobiales bacterium]|nr:protein-L-isoaspartate(D-aspartate) O-methyltransferase [Acidimicrobiales bacterium]